MFQLQSESINELIGALAKAQGQIVTAKKDKSNPYFKSTYADLASTWEACREALSNNGLAVVQSVQPRENGMELVTLLGHSSGQWIKSQMPILLAKADPQSIGSAITYYRRYSLAAIVGVSAAEDDDGNEASGRYDIKNEKSSKDNSQVELIKPSQAEELRRLIGDNKSLEAKIIGWLKKSYGITSLENITSDLYSRIRSWIIKENQAPQEAVA